MSIEVLQTVTSAPARRPPVIAHDDAELRAGLVTLTPELRGRAVRLAGDRTIADDIVQDTIERALRFAAQYERGTNLRAWVFQILFSVFVTRYRRSRRERNALKHLVADPYEWTTPAHFASAEAASTLTPSTRAKLDSLPEAFRTVIELVDLGESTYRDAATTLGVPVGTVMSRLHRGRRLMAEKMTRAETPSEAETRDAA
jgi:RNA polymerase sigma-70 factor (ECF subfamily)